MQHLTQYEVSACSSSDICGLKGKGVQLSQVIDYGIFTVPHRVYVREWEARETIGIAMRLSRLKSGQGSSGALPHFPL